MPSELHREASLAVLRTLQRHPKAVTRNAVDRRIDDARSLDVANDPRADRDVLLDDGVQITPPDDRKRQAHSSPSGRRMRPGNMTAEARRVVSAPSGIGPHTEAAEWPSVA